MAPPSADLVIVFRTGPPKSPQEALEAEAQYTKLLDALKNGGLKAVGRKAADDGHVLVFVQAPEELLGKLVQNERYRDFVNGVPSYSLPSVARDYGANPLTPAERIRFTHTYVVSAPVDGGLGITPDSASGWSRVESIMALHDREFNFNWIQSWTRHKLGLGFSEDELDGIKNQFGEQLAMYFAFLSFYAKALIFPTLLGIGFFLAGGPYHPVYSGILCLWSVIFVEWWRLRERAIAVRWGSFRSERVEIHRAQFQGAHDANEEHDDTSFPWWKRELRIIASLPVIGFFAAALTGLLTFIFVVEAFVTQLYTGPGVKYVSLVPTAMFILLVPRLVGFYQTYAVKLTGWENHVHESGHERSLALKTFALSSIVAYGGLYLSAFIYVPFGEQIMQLVQTTFFTSQSAPINTDKGQKIAAVRDAKKILNPDRLKNQVFAYLITNQIVGEFLEIGLPAILGWVSTNGAKDVKKGLKKVGWQDQKEKDQAGATESAASPEETAYLEDVMSQVALPAYDVFGDYSEMVTQFGYTVLWSTCWPLAPIGALVNNWFELRGDAIKIANLGRRPVPRRTDSIGPWMEILTFLTWQGALINSALVYLFYKGTTNPVKDVEFVAEPLSESFVHTLRSAIFPALLIALSTSHAYLLVRALVRHVLVRAVWYGSAEEIKLQRSEQGVKRMWLKEVGQVSGGNAIDEKRRSGEPTESFWLTDEGVSTIRRRFE